MSLLQTHCSLLDKCNYAKTHQERQDNLLQLAGFRFALEELKISYVYSCDIYYLDKGIDRLMCCGVWLDWTPTEV